MSQLMGLKYSPVLREKLIQTLNTIPSYHTMNEALDYRIDQRRSLVFPRQYRNCFSKDYRSAAQKLTNQNSRWHSNARFSWPEENDLPQHCRHCLFLTCSYRDYPVFLTQRNN